MKRFPRIERGIFFLNLLRLFKNCLRPCDLFAEVWVYAFHRIFVNVGLPSLNLAALFVFALVSAS
jgi:hypothetical protein